MHPDPAPERPPVPKPPSLTVSLRAHTAAINTLIDRVATAEYCCKRLISLIADDDGTYLSTFNYDYERATEALVKGES